MSGCVYKLGDKEFKTLEDMYKHILESNSNDVASDEVTQSEVLEMIQEVGSSVKFYDSKIVDGEKVDAHDYEYKGLTLKPVSTVIEEEYAYKGGEPGVKGVKAKEVGIAFHKVADDVVNDLNAGKSKDLILKSIVGASYQQWAKQVFDLYDGWSNGGKNKVLTEFRIANTSQGVAGTVDVAVVYPDGSIKIYDYKGTSSSYLKDELAGLQKRRSNNFQLNLYKRMLEIGDTKLGMKKLNVVGAAIIPIEFAIDVDESQNATLTGFKQLGPFEFDDEKIFADHTVNSSLAKLKFPVEGYDDRKGQIKTSQMPDWKGFIQQHLNIDLEAASYNLAASRLANGAKWDPEQGVYLYELNRKKYFFQDIEAQTDRGDVGRKARLNEIVRNHKNLLQDNYYSPADDLLHYINTGRAKSVDVKDIKDETANQLRTLSKMYKPKVDRAVKANSLPGLGDVGDDVIIVYKGFNPDSGNFSSLDLITINTDASSHIHVKQDKGSTILGKYASDSRAKIIAAKAGEHGVKVWDNTRRNANLIKMGLIAAHLQTDNPGIVVDRLSASRLGTKGAVDAIGIPVAEVLSQLKILSAMDSEGKSVLDISYGRDTKIAEMLKNKSLMDPKNYQGKGLEAYLRFAAISVVYDQEGMGDRTNQMERLRKWVKLGDNDKLLAGIYSESGLTTTMEAVEQNEVIKSQMLDALVLRQSDIEKLLGKDGDEAYTNNLEYQYVSRAILDLSGLTDQHTTFKKLNYVARELITPGMTGIEIVDQFIGRMQRTIGDMNRRLYKEHFVDSISKHEKLIKESTGTLKISANQVGDIYLPLLEHMDVPVYGDLNRTISRPTGRFWGEDTNQYKALSDTQKDYIKWFKEKMYTAMTSRMTPEIKEKFDKYWDKDMIPHMNPTIDTRFGDMLPNSKSSEGSKLDKMKNYFSRALDPYASKNEFVENLSNDYTEMVDRLENQKSFTGAPVDKFGDINRMDRFGFTADGLAKTTYIRSGDPEQKEVPITRTMDTNLENVLSHAMANMYRQESLSHLVPEFKAVKSLIAAANSTRFYKNKLLLNYLKSYVEKNLFQKNQITEEQETIAKWAIGGKVFANFMILDYNIMSQLKNTIAGFYHVTSTSIANPELGKHVPKAYVYSLANYDFVNSVMWTFGMSGADTDQLVNGFHTQVGRHGLASSHYKNLINYAGDYYHRSVFLVANLMKDGVIDSFTKNTNVDGAWYDYDESKDPRWKGDTGKARKEFTKLQLAKEGKIDANGKMTTPYTSYELQNMKREANEAFEAQNTEDQENFRNGVQGLLFGNFKSWWLQKVKRYAMPGAVMTSAKNLTKTVDPKTGEIGYSYDGTYMEGIFYTIVNMGNYLKSAYDMKSFAGFKEWKESLTPHQVQNIRRVLGDLSLLGGSIALGAFMFNGNAKANKDNAWYYLWFQSSNEINTWSYLTATPIIGSGSAIPSLGIVANFVKNPLQTITKPGFTKAFSFFGDSK